MTKKKKLFDVARHSKAVDLLEYASVNIADATHIAIVTGCFDYFYDMLSDEQKQTLSPDLR